MKNTFYRPETVNLKEFDTIVNKLRADLREFTDESVSDDEVIEYIKSIITFAKPLSHNPEMVFWGFDEPGNMPSDARVDYLYMPTYIVTAIMIRAFMIMHDKVVHIENFTDIFKKALNASTGRQMKGHGFDEEDGLIEALYVFTQVDTNKFIYENPDFYPAFTECFFLGVIVLTNRTLDPINPIKIKNRSDLLKRKAAQIIAGNTDRGKILFVYGTLMSGERNNGFLSGSYCLGKYILDDYAAYNLGSYPGIKRYKGKKVFGEAYLVDQKCLEITNRLENEGDTFLLAPVVVHDSEFIFNALAYVYNRETDEKNLIPEGSLPWTANI